MGREGHVINFAFLFGGGEFDAFDVVHADFGGNGFNAVESAPLANGFDMDNAAGTFDAFDVQFVAIRGERFDVEDGAVSGNGFDRFVFVAANQDFNGELLALTQGFDVQQVQVVVSLDRFDGMDFPLFVDRLYVQDFSVRMKGFDVPDFFAGRGGENQRERQ